MPSRLFDQIEASRTMELASLARNLKRAGRDIISLSSAEPDFDTPAHIVSAAQSALSNGDTKFTDTAGIPALRRAIVRNEAQNRHLSYEPDQVIVSGSLKQLFWLAMRVGCAAEDHIIFPTPYHRGYLDTICMEGCHPVIVDTAASCGKLTAMGLEDAISPKTRSLILTSPTYPSGSVYSKDELQQLAQVLHKYPHVSIVQDNSYDQMVFDQERFVTLAQADPLLQGRTISMNSFGISYAMTGLGVAFAVGSKDVIFDMVRLQGMTGDAPSSVSQAAAVEALNGPQDILSERRQVFGERLETATTLLKSSPDLTLSKPEAAFYLMVNCDKLIGKQASFEDAETGNRIVQRLQNDWDVALYLLRREGVAAMPGSAFGLPGTLRLSLATDTESIADGCHRINRAVSALKFG